MRFRASWGTDCSWLPHRRRPRRVIGLRPFPPHFLRCHSFRRGPRCRFRRDLPPWPRPARLRPFRPTLRRQHFLPRPLPRPLPPSQRYPSLQFRLPASHHHQVSLQFRSCRPHPSRRPFVRPRHPAHPRPAAHLIRRSKRRRPAPSRRQPGDCQAKAVASSWRALLGARSSCQEKQKPPDVRAADQEARHHWLRAKPLRVTATRSPGRNGEYPA